MKVPYSTKTVIGPKSSYVSSGAQTFEITEEGYYYIDLAGGGGGGANGYNALTQLYGNKPGGAGRRFIGKLYLYIGTYQITVGAGGKKAANAAGQANGSAGEATYINKIVDGSTERIITCNGGTGGRYGMNATSNGSVGSLAVYNPYKDSSTSGAGNNGNGNSNGSSGWASITLFTEGETYDVIKPEPYNIRVNTKYYCTSFAWISFVQPIIDENGVLGGKTFAVYSNVPQLLDANCAVFNAFNNSSGLFCSRQNMTTGYIDIYNPEPIRLPQINITNQNVANRASSNLIIYGSDDGENWTELNDVECNQEVSGSTIIGVGGTYKYFRLQSLSCPSDYWAIQKIDLIGDIKRQYLERVDSSSYYDITKYDYTYKALGV